MRYDLNNPHLDIEPIYDDVVITFKDERMVTEDLLDRIGNDILKLAEQVPPGQWMILDFKNVKFMSSAFLGFLVKVQTAVTQCRGRLKLRNLSPDLFKVFKITQLHKIFTIETAS
jgi:anti-anti-sigma factor